MMDDKQLDRMGKLVQLKVEMAKMGGVKPFDQIAGFIDKALQELVEEINPEVKQQKPDTVITPIGETIPNPEKPRPDVMPPQEVEAREDLERRTKYDEEIAKMHKPVEEVRR